MAGLFADCGQGPPAAGFVIPLIAIVFQLVQLNRIISAGANGNMIPNNAIIMPSQDNAKMMPDDANIVLCFVPLLEVVCAGGFDRTHFGSNIASSQANFASSQASLAVGMARSVMQALA